MNNTIRICNECKQKIHITHGLTNYLYKQVEDHKLQYYCSNMCYKKHKKEKNYMTV